ncbi:hypothetical protein FGB62_96g04 [Gracilaria domingensis]|nr:hypothetical protein FGB62_96g04 [Gracilaria domingensis]
MNSANYDAGKHEGLHFLFDSNEEMLQQPGVFVLISVLVNSPFMQPHGSRKLVAFLESLPFPSLVLVMDSINRHNIIALKGIGARRRLCVEEATRMALERGNFYFEEISKAMKENKSVADTEKIALVRYRDVIDERKERQEDILHKHYGENMCFRERIDEIAMVFLNERTPNSRYILLRKAHAANFILGELAIFVTGISYKEQRYQTLVYATSTISLAKIKVTTDATLWKLVSDIFKDGLFADLKEELIAADDGMQAQNGWPILSVSPKPADEKNMN